MCMEEYRKEGRDTKMQSVNSMNPLPSWLDSETRSLIKDVIGLLSERHPDLVVSEVLL